MGQNQSVLCRGANGQVIYSALRRVNFFGFIWIVSLSALAAWVAVMAQDDVMPTQYFSHGAQVVPNPVEDGGRVTVDIPIKRNRECPGLVHRVIRDGVTGKLVAAYDPMPSSMGGDLGDSWIKKTFELPEGLPAISRYQARVCFTCNALQHIKPLCTNAPDILFRVKPKAEQR
jgi:hypothetical protein